VPFFCRVGFAEFDETVQKRNDLRAKLTEIELENDHLLAILEFLETK
jgi:hypothetical protein